MTCQTHATFPDLRRCVHTRGALPGAFLQTPEICYLRVEEYRLEKFSFAFEKDDWGETPNGWSMVSGHKIDFQAGDEPPFPRAFEYVGKTQCGMAWKPQVSPARSRMNSRLSALLIKVEILNLYLNELKREGQSTGLSRLASVLTYKVQRPRWACTQCCMLRFRQCWAGSGWVPMSKWLPFNDGVHELGTVVWGKQLALN